MALHHALLCIQLPERWASNLCFRFFKLIFIFLVSIPRNPCWEFLWFYCVCQFKIKRTSNISFHIFSLKRANGFIASQTLICKWITWRSYWTVDSDLATLRWNLRIWVSNKLPGGADVAACRFTKPLSVLKAFLPLYPEKHSCMEKWEAVPSF